MTQCPAVLHSGVEQARDRSFSRESARQIAVLLMEPSVENSLSPTSQTPDPALTAPGDGAALPETVISASARVRFLQSLRDLWAYRDLFAAFVGRDLKVRYKQTALGVIWVLLQPLLTGGILALVFSRVSAGADSDFQPLLLKFMAALVPWTSFAMAVQNAALSLEANANMISKVYFPRMVIPGAFVVGSVLDFLIAFLALLIIALCIGVFTPLLLAAVLPLLLIQMMAALGLGLFFGALNAQYHDVKYMLPFMLQVGMFITVLRRLGDWDPAIQKILSLNPMAAVIETYRSLLMGTPIDFLLLAKGAAVALVFLIGGIWFFRSRESRLMDVL